MAQDSVSKKGVPPKPAPKPAAKPAASGGMAATRADLSQTAPDLSDADAVLIDAQASPGGATEQFVLKSDKTEQFSMPAATRTEQFSMTTADGDEPEALVNDQTAAEIDMEAAPTRPGGKLGATQAMSPAEVAAVKKKAAAHTMGPGSEGAGGEAPKATMLGDYKLLKKLGQGGMGSVFKAQQVKLDREVALKILSKELSSKEAFVKRFEREAKVMAKLDHPNILRCFDVGHAQGLHYLSMEFVEGGSIEGYLKKSQKFSLGDALHIILACASALEHAHEQNLIHRDIKPDNVLLTKKGVVKVADLGLAKAIDDDLSLTKTGTGAGTPIYMAPEQARDSKHVDGRADIYALGCMLYVFVTGEPPFKGETLVELIEAKEKGKFSPMRRFNPEVPERLDLIVDKMLAKDPKQRFATCTEIITEIGGLGVHNEHLSFIAEQPKSVVGRPAAVASPTMRPAVQTTSAQTPGKAEPGPAISDDIYYWQFTNDEKKLVTKKVKKEQLITLIKSGSIDAHGQVSKTPKGGYRSLGTYVEFSSLFRGAATMKEADKTKAKFKQAYKDLVKQDESRRRWRWLHNMFLRTGGLFGLLLWLVVVAGVLIGGFYGVKFLLSFLGEKVAKSGNL